MFHTKFHLFMQTPQYYTNDLFHAFPKLGMNVLLPPSDEMDGGSR